MKNKVVSINIDNPGPLPTLMFDKGAPKRRRIKLPLHEWYGGKLLKRIFVIRKFGFELSLYKEWSQPITNPTAGKETP